VRDTGGGPGTAATAAKSAIDDGARLILGPLLAAEVEAAKPVTQAANVPLIAFSTATQLAGNGTWLLGFDPRQEVERVTRYAQAHGHTNFAVLAPANAYGDLAATAARDAVTLVGANLARVGRYDPTSPDLASAVQRFAADVNFDALLLPEGGQRLRSLAPLLAFYHVDVTTVKLLGTGLWDEPGLGREPALEGGWYAAPAPASRADFEKRFEALYKHAPPRLATLGYDAMALAAVLARGNRGEEFSAAALTNPSGFAGLDGIFRLRSDGVAERGLAVLEVHRTGTTVIDEAPTSFQAAPKY
jgi:ABC-type branched-subunit amino acid transport system substrate-binding protein